MIIHGHKMPNSEIAQLVRDDAGLHSGPSAIVAIATRTGCSLSEAGHVYRYHRWYAGMFPGRRMPDDTFAWNPDSVYGETPIRGGRTLTPRRINAGLDWAGQLREKINTHRTAKHEAAHAAIALHFGASITRVTADADSGRCVFSPPSDWTGLRAAMVSIAGSVISGVPLTPNTNCCHDYLDTLKDLRRAVEERNAATFTAAISPTEDQLLNFAEELRADVDSILSEHWEFIKRLGAKLVEDGVVDGDIVQELWDAHK